MNPDELVKFLNVLRNFVPPYWKDRIDHTIHKMNGKVRRGTADIPTREYE
jgi:hypothetical protein